MPAILRHGVRQSLRLHWELCVRYSYTKPVASMSVERQPADNTEVSLSDSTDSPTLRHWIHQLDNLIEVSIASVSTAQVARLEHYFTSSTGSQRALLLCDRPSWSAPRAGGRARLVLVANCLDSLTNKKHLKNVGPIRHCEPPHALILHCHSAGVATVTRRHCRTPPAHRCPRQRRRQQRQRVTEGTAMAPWNGPNNTIYLLFSAGQ